MTGRPRTVATQDRRRNNPSPIPGFRMLTGDGRLVLGLSTYSKWMTRPMNLIR